jgi:hypothetical protein
MLDVHVGGVENDWRNIMQTRKERLAHLHNLLRFDLKYLRNKLELVNRLAASSNESWDDEHERILQILEKKIEDK